MESTLIRLLAVTRVMIVADTPLPPSYPHHMALTRQIYLQRTNRDSVMSKFNHKTCTRGY